MRTVGALYAVVASMDTIGGTGIPPDRQGLVAGPGGRMDRAPAGRP